MVYGANYVTTIIRHTHCVLHSHLAVTHPIEGDEGEGGGGEGARQADAHTLPQLEEAGGGAEDR